MDVKELYEKIDDLMGKEVLLQGWIRNHRKQKEFGFIDFSDGTCFKHVQLVYNNKLASFEDIQKIKISKNYLGLFSWMIDRAFKILPGSLRNQKSISSVLNKNKPLLLKVLYEVNSSNLLKCFSKNC